MPPELRRRGQPPPPQQLSDSDDALDFDEELSDIPDDDEVAVDEAEGFEEEEEEELGDFEGEEEGQSAGSPDLSSLNLHAPIPPNYREISTLASWTVSSSKPGCSIPQLRNPSTSLFWQSDGPQPHYLNIHFFKLVRIVGLRLYLDFEADESYTPTRIVFLAGSGGNDLVEWGEMRLEQPRGWIWADFSGVGDVDEDDDEDDDEDTHAPEEAEGFPGQQPSRLTSNPSDATTITHDPNPDSMNLDPPQPQMATPAQTQGHTQAAIPTPGTTQTQPSTSSPTLHLTRSQPRRPLQHITPSRATTTQTPRKKPRTPILRAHLVQIKILENHQNGKDTHLRGLQIFALDNESARPARAAEVRTPGGKAVGRMSSGGGKSGGGKKKGGLAGRFGGLGLGSGKWDVEPTIR